MKRFLFICLIALLGLPAFSQGVLNVRVNEVLVINDNDVVDGYGNRSSWIEVFNTGYERVNIEGCYIGIRYADRFDADGQKLVDKYYIPKSDPNTAMGPLEYKLFYCEGADTKGTFYTSFTLQDANVDMVILYNSNGKDVISVFQFPQGYKPVPDVSLGLIGHDEPESYIFPKLPRELKKEWKNAGLPTNMGDHYLDWLGSELKYKPQRMAKTTPGATNEAAVDVPRHELFRRSDPSGVVMTVTAMGVVFLALVFMFLVFKLFGKFMVSRTNKKEAVSKGVAREETKAKTTSYSGEEIAAIGFALQMFQDDLHVDEATVITINRVGRMYSPWSSKIYGLRQMPEKKNR